MTNETMSQTDLISELIQAVKNQKRPETISVPVYGKYSDRVRTFLYSDANKNYDTVESVAYSREVRSAKAFAKCIKEELKRQENVTGAKATVMINLSGGNFIPDDDFNNYQIKFSRLNSQQWNLIKNAINKTMNHNQFLLLLQGLKPSFKESGVNFNDLFQRFSTLRLIGRSEITSNPIITEQGQTQGYKVTYKLEENGCDGEETFPTGFDVSVAFAKAGEKTYNLPIDLLFSRTDDNNIQITVLCPEFENIEERAIFDEADFIKEETKDLAELLVLADF